VIDKLTIKVTRHPNGGINYKIPELRFSGYEPTVTTFAAVIAQTLAAYLPRPEEPHANRNPDHPPQGAALPDGR